jgi:hypothetical protein
MNNHSKPEIISDEETFFGFKDVIEIRNDR